MQHNEGENEKNKNNKGYPATPAFLALPGLLRWYRAERGTGQTRHSLGWAHGAPRSGAGRTGMEERGVSGENILCIQPDHAGLQSG